MMKPFRKKAKPGPEEKDMAFFNSAVTVLQTLVIALDAGLGVWGVVNLLEGYGNDYPGAKSQGMKQHKIRAFGKYPLYDKNKS